MRKPIFMLILVTMGTAQFIRDDSTVSIFRFDEYIISLSGLVHVQDSVSGFVLSDGGLGPGNGVADDPSGKFGHCANMSGVKALFNQYYRDYGSGMYNTDIYNLPKISIEVWVKWESGGPGGYLFTNQNCYSFWVNGNSLAFTVPTWFDQISDTATITTGEWHYLAVTYAFGDTIRFYLDGRMLSQAYEGHGLRSDPKTNIFIGALTASTGAEQAPITGKFTGKMDELRITKGIRTSEEILAHWEASTVGSTKVASPSIKTTSEIRLRPNPVTSHVWLQAPELYRNATLSIFNIKGVRVWNVVYSNNGVYWNANVPSGMYVYKIKSGRSIVSGNFKVVR